MKRMRPLLALLLFVLFTAATRADDLPYPAGTSQHVLEGLKTTLILPSELSARRPASLILLLHGSGDSGANLAPALQAWVEKNYVVCAPTATEPRAWTLTDVQAVSRIGHHLLKVLPLDRKHVHTIGFSDGGWNLAPLAFDDSLKPCSATWVAAGYKGGKVGKWAKKGMGVLALAGAQDGSANAARGTVPALLGKVRSAEVRIQPNLGHKWPRELMPYLQWWMGVQEGRFTPGEDRNFEWTDDIDAAVESQRGKKRGGVLLYVFDAKDADKAEAKALQNEVLMDPLVRHYGRQLATVKWNRVDFVEGEDYGVKATPAVVVLGRDGTVKKKFEGKIKASSLAKALRSVAPDKKRPKR